MKLREFLRDCTLMEFEAILGEISREVGFFDKMGIYYARQFVLDNWLIIGGKTPFYFALHEMYDDREGLKVIDWNDRLVWPKDVSYFYKDPSDMKKDDIVKHVGRIAPVGVKDN